MSGPAWKGVGTAGWWDAPGGRRLWLQHTDRVTTREDGSTVLVRVTSPPSVSLFGGDENRRLVLTSVVDGSEPFSTVGTIDLVRGAFAGLACWGAIRWDDSGEALTTGGHTDAHREEAIAYLVDPRNR